MTLETALEEIKLLEEQKAIITKKLVTFKREFGLENYCCSDAEYSNGWHHSYKCKNWVLTF